MTHKAQILNHKLILGLTPYGKKLVKGQEGGVG